MNQQDSAERFRKMSFKELDSMIELMITKLEDFKAVDAEMGQSRGHLVDMVKEIRERLYRGEKHQIELLQHISRYGTRVPDFSVDANLPVCDQEIGYLREILVNLSHRGLVTEIIPCAFHTPCRHWEIVVPLT